MFELDGGLLLWGLCVAMLSLGSVFEGAGCRGEGGQGCVWVCTHARACRDGASPLYVASGGGHLTCVEALIRLKADVLQCDS